MDTELKEILNKITKLTTKIQKNHPELHHHLKENPSTFGKEPEAHKQEFKDYLETLEALLDKTPSA